MPKIKLFVICLFAYLLIFAVPAKAAPLVYIQTLPGYISYVDFKLSCTSNGNTAQFYSRKDGGSWTAFGPLINLATDPCQVQVSNAQFGSEGLFHFEVVISGGEASAETSTTLDTTPPGGISDFGKSRTGGGSTYHLTWKNPSDSDYQRVFIYRGTEPGFESDGNKIAEAGGAPGDNMSYDDGSLDPGKEYYYYFRALDHANNASGLSGDSTTTTVYTTPTPGTGTTGRVTVLPKEQGTGGSVLGTEASPTPEATIQPKGSAVDQINQFAAQTPEPFKWILTHKKISIGILIILGLLVYYGLKARQK